MLTYLLPVAFFLWSFSFSLVNAESNYDYGEDGSPELELGLSFTKQGMRAFQAHYTNFVIYTMNLSVPGNVEIGVYNQNINDKIETVPFYRWRMGPVEHTGNNLDFFIEAQQRGFFVIKLPFGIGYTRDGRINKDIDNRLVTVAGHFPVLGENGDIYVPDGFISVAANGTIFVDGDRVDKFKVAVFKDRERLVSLNGSVFYLNGPPDYLEGEEFYKVRQGFLEQGNVLKALTGDMSIASKSYEGSAKAAKMIIKMMQSGIQLANPN